MVAEPTQKVVPEFRPGDTIRVHIKVIEGESERVQAFEGTCLSRRGHGDSASFTVRKVSFGVGVERTFPVISPSIDKIELVKAGRVRRARLYYLQNLTGKAARVTDEVEQQAPTAPSAKAPKAESEKPAPSAEKKAESAKSAKADGAAKKAAAGAAAK